MYLFDGENDNYFVVAQILYFTRKSVINLLH